MHFPTAVHILTFLTGSDSGKCIAVDDDDTGTFKPEIRFYLLHINGRTNEQTFQPPHIGWVLKLTRRLMERDLELHGEKMGI